MGRLPARHLSTRSDSPGTGPSRGREPAAAVPVCAEASTSRPRRAPGRGAGRGRGVACTNGIAGVGRPQLRAKFNREFWCCPRTRVSTVAVMVLSLNCIVAVSQNMGIGKNGDLPWPPLREPPKGAHFLAKSLDDALKLIEQPELRSKVDMVWIVGGSSVYKEAMNKPGHIKLFVTRIMQEFESDIFFPEIDLGKYKLLPEYPGVLSDVQEEKGIKYKFEVYEKND
ncbi:dihydrofolate reductase isoform X1 [Pteropus medius]|uniref:dihydrofolate reductase isoform X1 n=1 Tax=Pteropus vampyrus TaxID=132908 RepID=UPI00196A7D26|nr:dihydrofolate reductase isoform X1 [Pteropus giganteus]